MLTLFLAKLIGIVAIVKGIAILSKKKECASVVGEFMHDKPLMYFVSILELVGGLAIVLNHNIWAGSTAAVIITIMGWLMIAEGIAVAVLPQRSMTKLFKSFTKGGALNSWGFVALIIGIYLTYVGFWG